LLFEAGAEDTIANRCGLRAVHLAATPDGVQMLKFMAKISSDLGNVRYHLDGLDLTVLLNSPGYHMVRTYVEVLLHLASLYPNDHAWRLYLALEIFKLGHYATAAMVREQSLRLNSQNAHVMFLENLAQSVECDRCKEPICGRHWICTTCYIQFCSPCHTSKRMEVDCRYCGTNRYKTGYYRRHYFLGFPAYQCTLGALRLIGVGDDIQLHRVRQFPILADDSSHSYPYYLYDGEPSKCSYTYRFTYPSGAPGAPGGPLGSMERSRSRSPRRL